MKFTGRSAGTNEHAATHPTGNAGITSQIKEHIPGLHTCCRGYDVLTYLLRSSMIKWMLLRNGTPAMYNDWGRTWKWLKKFSIRT